MRRLLYNKKGIALVTSLMFTVLSLVITLTLLYMVTSGIKNSGAMKRYKTATEAAYGGADIMMKDIFTKGLTAALNAAVSETTFKSDMAAYLTNLSSTTPVISDCLKSKMTNYFNENTKKWTSTCADNTLNLGPNSFDLKFSLGSSTGTPFVVYTKIVDTMQHRSTVYENISTASGRGMKAVIKSMAGNTEPSSLGLNTGATSSPDDAHNPHVPYVYRIEVQAERELNPTEKSKLTLQYIY